MIYSILVIINSNTVIFFLQIAILDVNLTSTPVCVNSSSNVSLTCTATLPHDLKFPQVFNWTKVFKWTRNGTDITSSASDPTDPMGITSVSTLNTPMTTPGVFVFKCEVRIDVMGDPVETNSSSSTVIVPGMKKIDKCMFTNKEKFEFCYCIWSGHKHEENNDNVLLSVIDRGFNFLY